MNLQFHPVLKDAPLMNEEEQGALAANIRHYGQKYEILVLNRKFIIDGRNRYLACKKLGIEPRLKYIVNNDPEALVASMNLFRRHWSTKERKELAMRFLRVAEVVSTDGMEKMSNDIPTEAQVANMLGLSKSTVARFKSEERKERGVRAILREISPAKLIPQMDKAQRKIVKKIGELIDQISRQEYVVWIAYPESLFQLQNRLAAEAERVAGLEMKELPTKKRKKKDVIEL